MSPSGRLRCACCIVCKETSPGVCAARLVAGGHKGDDGELTEEEEEEELERQEAAIEVVGEMQLTAEQLKVGPRLLRGTPHKGP